MGKGKRRELVKLAILAAVGAGLALSRHYYSFYVMFTALILVIAVLADEPAE